MYSDDTKRKLQNIIGGAHIDWQADYCTAARNFLCTCLAQTQRLKKNFDRQSAIKKKQAKALINFINKNNLWPDAPSQANRFIRNCLKLLFH